MKQRRLVTTLLLLLLALLHLVLNLWRHHQDFTYFPKEVAER